MVSLSWKIGAHRLDCFTMMTMGHDRQGVRMRNAASERSYFWVLYTSAGFLFAGVVVRSLLVVSQDVLPSALALLGAWLALLVCMAVIPGKWTPWSIAYLALQTGIVVGLLLLPGDEDFFVVLFAVLSMQAVQRFGFRWGVPWLVLFAALMMVAFLADLAPAQAVALTLAYSAVNVLTGAYALATRQAVEARDRNKALGRELEVVNAELRDSTLRLERLAVAKERNRLARDLHDSVTQTLFSMTLAGQSALLLQHEPSKLDAQLERLRELGESALAEMKVLVSELRPDSLGSTDLVESLRREGERRAQDGIAVSLHVDEEKAPGGAPALSAAEQSMLLRVAQEALNNIVKHSGSKQAVVILSMRDRPSLEIRDEGKGFDLQQAERGPGLGLGGMQERATELGWTVEVTTEPGAGTRVLIMRHLPEGERK
jgi:signal transduction histidine kinase